MERQVIIDLETLDISPKSVVLSIGVVWFNFSTGEIDKGLNIKLSTKDQIENYGRTVSEKVVNWWKKQPPEAQKILARSDKDVPLKDALKILNFYFEKNQIEKKTFIWTRGNNFDCPILESMFIDGNLKAFYDPFKFRDIRTFIETVEMFADAFGKQKPTVSSVKNDHNSLSDCINDATKMIELVKLFN